MIVWHHVMKTKENYSWNKLAAKCLRETHRVQTIGELNDFIKTNEVRLGNECTKQEACLKMAKRLIEMPSEKWDSNKRTPYKDNLDHTEKRKQQFQKYIEGKTNLYNPDITEKTNQKTQLEYSQNKNKRRNCKTEASAQRTQWKWKKLGNLYRRLLQGRQHK